MKRNHKEYIQENILKLRVQLNSLDSHLTRIEKMSQIKTSIKIQSKSEKLLITI